MDGKIWDELIAMRRDFVAIRRDFANNLKLLQEFSEVQGRATIGLLEQLEKIEKQVGLLHDLGKLHTKSSDIQHKTTTGLLEREVTRSKQLERIEEQISLVKKTVGNNFENLEKIKRVVDQNSLILESETNGRAT